MIKNDSNRPIRFCLFDVLYIYIIKYPSTHTDAFTFDLIAFGQYIESNKMEVIKNINHFVVEWWKDRQYEIELI